MSALEMSTSENVIQRQKSTRKKGRISFSDGLGSDATPTKFQLGPPAETNPLSVNVHTNMLVELYDFIPAVCGETRWQQTARWIKYEEDAEGLDKKSWGKPHVPLLSFAALLTIRKCLEKGLFMLDIDGHNFDQLCEVISRGIGDEFGLDEETTADVLATLNIQHRDSYESVARLHSIASGVVSTSLTTSISHDTALADANGYPEAAIPPYILRNHVSVDREKDTKCRSVSHYETKAGHDLILGKQSEGVKMSRDMSFTAMDHYDQHELLKRVPDHAESAQVFCGVVRQLKDVHFAMVRLQNAIRIPELLEAAIPIRFLLVILGPELADIDYHELGRSIATLMSNSEFNIEAYRATSATPLLNAFDTFANSTVIVPPGDIDSKRLLEVEDIKKSLKKRHRAAPLKKLLSNQLTPLQEEELDGNMQDGIVDSITEDQGAYVSTISPISKSPLTRTGKWFGGVMRDIRNRRKYYLTDFKDALNVQCLTSVIFMFFAAFAPAVTFGGLIDEYTDGAMGTTETLFAQCLGGVVWSFFSAQPLLILSPTGPVLIFEASLYKFCKAFGFDFMVFRVWSSIWVMFIALLMAAFEAVSIVKFVTPFTEDIFSSLISIIFIAESIKFLMKSYQHHPVRSMGYYEERQTDCYRLDAHFKQSISLLNRNSSDNAGSYNYTTAWNPFGPYEFVSKHRFDCPDLVKLQNNMSVAGYWDGSLIQSYIMECCKQENQPDTAILTTNLLVGTFVMALLLKRMAKGKYLGRGLRRILSDFSVLITIVIVCLFTFLVFGDSHLQRLSMPDTVQFTDVSHRGHGLLVSFELPSQKWWGYLIAVVPAFLVFILFFVETEITGLLLAKKEKGLQKGTGYHWDLLLVGLMCFICSVFGLPWMCAAAVQSLAHASSLTVMNKHAPGEKPSVAYVIEQRVTAMGCSLLIGACAFAGSVLHHLPMAVLFGVFLYLGFMNMRGVQLVQRVMLLFLPRKYFPYHPFCQQVGFWRMHMFTCIQMLLLVIMYMVKHFKTTAIAFPFVLMLIALFRFYALPKIFEKGELIALDGLEGMEEDDYFDAE